MHLLASGAKLCEALKEALGKPRDWETVDVGKRLGKIQGSLEKFLPVESWPPTLAVGQSLDKGPFDARVAQVRKLATQVKALVKKGVSNGFVFVDLAEYVSFGRAPACMCLCDCVGFCPSTVQCG